jgi:hypothetical protein
MACAAHQFYCEFKTHCIRKKYDINSIHTNKRYCEICGRVACLRCLENHNLQACVVVVPNPFTEGKVSHNEWMQTRLLDVKRRNANNHPSASGAAQQQVRTDTVDD